MTGLEAILVEVDLTWTSQVALMLKNLSANQEILETQVLSLGCEDPLEEGMATHSRILSWRVPWTEEPGRLQSTATNRVGHDWSNLVTCAHMDMKY